MSEDTPFWRSERLKKCEKGCEYYDRNKHFGEVRAPLCGETVFTAVPFLKFQHFVGTPNRFYIPKAPSGAPPVKNIGSAPVMSVQ